MKKQCHCCVIIFIFIAVEYRRVHVFDSVLIVCV